MNPWLEKEIKALRLIHRGWDERPEEEKQALHHSYMFALEAAVEVGLMRWERLSEKE